MRKSAHTIRSQTAGFLKGAAVLGAAGLFAKVVGAVYRIPVAGLLGTEGSGYYGMAYPIFSALAAVSTLGIPTGVSQLVASRVGAGDAAGAARLFRVSMRFLVVLGCVLSLAFFLLSGYLADVVKAPDAVYSFRAVAPAFVFVSLLAGVRGYLQGYLIMTPTAVSQVVEQIGKLAFGLSAVWIVMAETGSPALSAAAALFGITLAEGAALLSVTVSFLRSPLRQPARSTEAPQESSWADLRALLAMTVPVTIGACVMPVILSLDSLEVSPALQAAGMAPREAASQVGILTMNVAPFVNMPTALSAALAMSVVPALAAAEDGAGARQDEAQVSVALKVAVCIALPCAAGLAMFAAPILRLLFRSLSDADLETAARLLRIMSISVFLLVLLQAITGILQGVRHQVLPVIALAVGAVLKAVLTPVLVRAMGVTGAAWASCTCFAAAFAIDVHYLRRRAAVPVDRRTTIAGPLLSASVMCAAASAVYLPVSRLSASAAVILAVALGAVVYVAMLCRTGSITRSELALVPGGKALGRIAGRIGLWKT